MSGGDDQWDPVTFANEDAVTGCAARDIVDSVTDDGQLPGALIFSDLTRSPTAAPSPPRTGAQRLPSRAMRVAPLAVAVLLSLAACKEKSNAVAVGADTAPLPSVTPTSTCDADAEWFDGGSVPDRTPAENLAAFTTRWKGRTPQCRTTAMRTACDKHGCDDLMSGVLIAAATSPLEASALRQVRLDGNVAALGRGRPLYTRTKELVTYANSVISAPRSSAFNKATTLDGRAQDLANENPCIVRLKRDFARVDVVSADLERALPTLPFGTMLLRSVLISVKACLNCSDDDRYACKDAVESLKSADDALAEYEADVARDRKAVGALARPSPSLAAPPR